MKERAQAFYNDSGEDIPPFAVLEIVGMQSVADRAVLKVRKPTSDVSEMGYRFNGPFQIPIEKTGRCTSAYDSTWSMYDTGDTPVEGEAWGPIPGEWMLSKSGGGFTIVGGADSDRGIVQVTFAPQVLRFAGPCAKFDPPEEADDTDFEVDWDSGCLGPSRVALNYVTNPFYTADPIIAELEDAGPPLKLSTGFFTISCGDRDITVYAEIVVDSLDVDGVTLTYFKDSAPYVVYKNTVARWLPMVGGYLQYQSGPCDCPAFGPEVCISLPNR